VHTRAEVAQVHSPKDLPRPIEPGDIAALEHGRPLRIAALVELDPGGTVDLLAEVEPARIFLLG
jgi:hypothetical protein